MLVYISKDKPQCLDGLSVSKKPYMNSMCWWLSNCTDIQFDPNEDTKIIKIDDTLSIYPLSDKIDLKKVSKEKQIGKPFQLGDGQNYLFPVLRCCPDGTQLPTRLKLTENGLQYIVKDTHLKAWNVGERIWSFFVDKKQMSDQEIIESIAAVLRINYNITIYDILVYGLIDADIDQVMKHLVDIDKWLEHLKVTDEEHKRFLDP